MGGSSLSPFNIAISYCTQQNSPASGPVQRFVLIPMVWCCSRRSHCRPEAESEREECVLFNQFSLAQVLLQLPTACSSSCSCSLQATHCPFAAQQLHSAPLDCTALRLLSTSTVCEYVCVNFALCDLPSGAIIKLLLAETIMQYRLSISCRLTSTSNTWVQECVSTLSP